nr:uncharacterized protein LOC128686309 [Cherax quadricarinatus]
MLSCLSSGRRVMEAHVIMLPQGGVKAVVYTDVMQTLLMFGGVLLVVIISYIDLGGVGNIWAEAEKGSRIEFFNLDTSPFVRHTFHSLDTSPFVRHTFHSLDTSPFVRHPFHSLDTSPFVRHTFHSLDTSPFVRPTFHSP